MSSLQAIPAVRLVKLMEKFLCESRGSRYGRVLYERFDLTRPISFQEDGLVPVSQQQQIIRTLGITVEKYLAMLESISV